MKVKEIIWQSRRDFDAIYVCEHCENEQEGGGYDDTNFHANVIPVMACKACGKIAPDDYRALSTKYPDGQQV